VRCALPQFDLHLDIAFGDLDGLLAEHVAAHHHGDQGVAGRHVAHGSLSLGERSGEHVQLQPCAAKIDARHGACGLFLGHPHPEGRAGGQQQLTDLDLHLRWLRLDA
jgi:hypothetical protein